MSSIAAVSGPGGVSGGRGARARASGPASIREGILERQSYPTREAAEAEIAGMCRTSWAASCTKRPGRGCSPRQTRPAPARPGGPVLPLRGPERARPADYRWQASSASYQALAVGPWPAIRAAACGR